MSNHKKKHIYSKYHFNEFEVSSLLFKPQTDAWERTNILLTKFRQRTFHNDYVYYKENGELRYIYSTLKEIQILLGTKWKDLLQLLIDNDILVQIPFKNPKNSTQNLYTFSAFRMDPVKYKTRVTNARVHNSLNSFYDNRKKEFSPMVKGVILPNLRKTKLWIYDELFWEAVERYYPEYSKKTMDRNREPMNYETYLKQYEYLLHRFQAFNSATGNEIYDFITEDKFSGRIHTIITQLPRFLRKIGVVIINGMPLIELDLFQSQPSILAKVLENTDYADWFMQQPDCYLALQKKFSLSNRDSAKEFMFRLMFGMKYGKYHKLFVEIFPVAGKELTKMKSVHNPLNPNSRIGKCHSNVAWEMQRREITIFRNLWKKLNKKRIPFVTIHDALLVPVFNYKEVEELMEHEFKLWLPNPSINISFPLNLPLNFMCISRSTKPSKKLELKDSNVLEYSKLRA